MKINPFKHSVIAIFLFLNIGVSPVVAVNIDTSFCSIQIQKVSRFKYFNIVDLSLKWNNDDSLRVVSSYNCLFEQIGIQNSKDRDSVDDTPSNVYFTYAGRNDENHIIVFDIYYYEYGGIFMLNTESKDTITMEGNICFSTNGKYFVNYGGDLFYEPFTPFVRLFTINNGRFILINNNLITNKNILSVKWADSNTCYLQVLTSNKRKEYYEINLLFDKK